MTHIEQLHLDAIQKDKTVRKHLCVNDWGTSDLEITVAKKSAEITKQIACDFMDWYWDSGTEKLFQEYLKSKENETTTNTH